MSSSFLPACLQEANRLAGLCLGCQGQAGWAKPGKASVSTILQPLFPVLWVGAKALDMGT